MKPFSMTVYQGKRFDPTPVGTLQGTNVVMNLMKDSRLLRKVFHVFADSFFSSLNLANKLLEIRQLTIHGEGCNNGEIFYSQNRLTV
jgi:hypothetical protein